MHEVIRQSVQQNIDRNVEYIRQKMLGRGGRVIQSFSVGDVVRLRIPGADRTRLGRKFLPCKVLEIVRDNLYRLGCTLGTLDVCYQAADLELTLADFDELKDIPDTTVSLTEVARRLALVNSEESRVCNCQSNCSTRRCSCKRANSICSQRCHPNNQCSNH